MKSLKSALLFLGGVGIGVVVTLSLVFPGNAAWAAAQGKAPFKDIPASHAAATSVATMKNKGIVTGYPDNTYRGSEPVTRYELAVVLARFAKYYDTSTKPIATSKVVLPPAPVWSDHARQYLAANGFVPPTSPLFSNPGNTDATRDLFADSLSSILDHIVDRSLPPTQN